MTACARLRLRLWSSASPVSCTVRLVHCTLKDKPVWFQEIGHLGALVQRSQHCSTWHRVGYTCSTRRWPGRMVKLLLSACDMPSVN